MTTQKQQDISGLAIASLILGVFSLTGAGPLAGIPAIITGIIALKNPADKSMAIAGIILGSISLLLAVLVVIGFILLLALGLTLYGGYAPSTELPGQGQESSQAVQRS